jgi:hypothetical protein
MHKAISAIPITVANTNNKYKQSAQSNRVENNAAGEP